MPYRETARYTCRDDNGNIHIVVATQIMKEVSTLAGRQLVPMGGEFMLNDGSYVTMVDDRTFVSKGVILHRID